jgi:uncharacterized membrane protein
MNPIANLCLATFAFLATHFIPSTSLRARLIARLGERPYLGLYAVIALVTIVWMITAYVRAPSVPLWGGWRYLPAALMPFSLMLLVLGLFPRASTPAAAEDPLKAAAPAHGVFRITRHPLMWAIMLWSGAHVAANGDARSLIFFGGFFVLASIGPVLMERRKAAGSRETWERFAAVTSNVPFVAIAQRRNTLDWREIGYGKPLAALILYALLFFLHPYLFGVRPY